METFECPRRSWGMPIATAEWRADDTCSYCGSLNPATFMERLRAETVEVGPTDKNYKAYLHNRGGATFKQTYRTDNAEHPSGHVWVTRDMDQTKFYFQHLDEAQRAEFITALNTRKMHIGYPGYFYTPPFFVTFEKPVDSTS